MQTDNRLFDDFVKFVNGAAGTLSGVARETEGAARERAREWIGGMDFVSREEFDTVKAMAQAAREEVELLKARIDALEGKAGEPVTKSVKTPKAKVNEPLARSIEGVAPVADDNE